MTLPAFAAECGRLQQMLINSWYSVANQPHAAAAVDQRTYGRTDGHLTSDHSIPHSIFHSTYYVGSVKKGLCCFFAEFFSVAITKNISKKELYPLRGNRETT